MANPIAIPGTVVNAGSLVTPGGAQGVSGLQGPQGPAGGTGGSVYTASQSVLLAGTNFTLLNDVATPGNGQFYGYSGVARGWFTPPTYTGSQSVLLTGSNFTLVSDVATPANGQAYSYRNTARGWFQQPLFNVVDFGADPTGAADSAPAINAAMAAAGSQSIIFFPVGTYLINSTITITKQFRMMGATMYGSLITTNSATLTMFQVQCNLSVDFDSIHLARNVTPTTGVGITYDGGTPGSTPNQLSRIEHCAFDNHLTAIHFINAQQFVLTGCNFSESLNTSVGVLVENRVNIDAGESNISDCWFGTPSSTPASQIAIQVNSSGGLKITNCFMVYHQLGIFLGPNYPSPGTTSVLIITGCSIENNTNGVLLQGTVTGDYWLTALISGNEFQVGANQSGINSGGISGLISGVTITGNMFELSSSAEGIIVGGLESVNINGNIFHGTNASETGIAILASSSFCLVSGNTMPHVPTKITCAGSTNNVIVQLGAEFIAFASLPANASPGSLIYCSDAKGVGDAGYSTMMAAVAGGTGALLIRKGATWYAIG